MLLLVVLFSSKEEEKRETRSDNDEVAVVINVLFHHSFSYVETNNRSTTHYILSMMNSSIPSSSIPERVLSPLMRSLSANGDEDDPTTFVPPDWMIQFVEFRKRLFLRTVEPIIVTMLGPVVDENEEQPSLGETTYGNLSTMTEAMEGVDYFDHHTNVSSAIGNSNRSSWSFNYVTRQEMNMHRRLSFLPSYVEDINQYRETSMSFATLAMLFVLMSCMLLVFLSCFYHNQKTSPLFISPRRHRLPKLVPPPLPVDGYFSWVSTKS